MSKKPPRYGAKLIKYQQFLYSLSSTALLNHNHEQLKSFSLLLRSTHFTHASGYLQQDPMAASPLPTPCGVWASDKTLLMKESLLKATLKLQLSLCQKIMLMPPFPPLTMGYISLRGSCQHTPAVVNNEEFVC